MKMYFRKQKSSTGIDHKLTIIVHEDLGIVCEEAFLIEWGAAASVFTWALQVYNRTDIIAVKMNGMKGCRIA